MIKKYLYRFIALICAFLIIICIIEESMKLGVLFCVLYVIILVKTRYMCL